jgi:hypothetical protein
MFVASEPEGGLVAEDIRLHAEARAPRRDTTSLALPNMLREGDKSYFQFSTTMGRVSVYRCNQTLRLNLFASAIGGVCRAFASSLSTSATGSSHGSGPQQERVSSRSQLLSRRGGCNAGECAQENAFIVTSSESDLASNRLRLRP